MSDYPRHLYRVPGPYGGGVYDVAGAADEEQEAELLEQGWFLTVDEAVGERPAEPDVPAAKAKPAAPEAPKPSKPNMERMNELRARYRELAGKGGGPRWDEATYAKKIAELESRK